MDSDWFDLAVIIPANNEECHIEECLRALLRQDNNAGCLQIIVAANACTDKTEEISNSLVSDAQARGWLLTCQSSAYPGKLEALNRADKLVRSPARIYLDADVICDPGLIGQLREALNGSEPIYATGTIMVAPAKSWFTRRYADFWLNLPFVRGGAVGAGLFAVNAAGRARWGEFPSIISDDTYARLNFSPAERIEVPARYHWPMVEGLGNLIRVRRRQDAGVREVYRYFPALQSNEGKAKLTTGGLAKLALSMPIAFGVYMMVHIAVKLLPTVSDWRRGR